MLNMLHFFGTPGTSRALLRIQLRITPIIRGNGSAAFTTNPSKFAKALSLFLIHSLFHLQAEAYPPPKNYIFEAIKDRAISFQSLAVLA